MQYFKTENGQVFAYEDDCDPIWFVAGGVRMTPEEVYAHEHPTPTQEELDAIAKVEAQAYLNSTDWYFARFIETGREVPEDVVAKRAATREIL